MAEQSFDGPPPTTPAGGRAAPHDAPAGARTTAPLLLPGLLPLRPVPGQVTEQGRRATPSEALAHACYMGDRDLIGRHAFEVILGARGTTTLTHSPVGPWLALAASRIPDPESVTDIHSGWTDLLARELDVVCVEAYAHGIDSGADLDAAIRVIWSAAFLAEMHDVGGVCELIDALVDAEIVWVARKVAQACHDHNGRYNEVSHLIKALGCHAATDTRGFTGWNLHGAIEGIRWSARPDAPAAVLCPTAARLRRLGGPHLTTARDYGWAAVLDAPADDFPLNGLAAIARDMGDTATRDMVDGLLASNPVARTQATAAPRQHLLPGLRRQFAERWKGPE